MDDRYAYMLNTLWAKYYDLGRIIRFRSVSRGRQAVCYEVLTAEQHEYLAHIFPPAFDPAQLTRMCQAINILDKERFSVVPMMPAQQGAWVVGGPQGTWLAVGLATNGQYLLPDQCSIHDLSQLGLRLAWLHRLLAEQLAPPPDAAPLADALQSALQRATQRRPLPLDPADVSHLQQSLQPPLPESQPSAVSGLSAFSVQRSSFPGWVHGDLQPAAILMDEDHQIRTIVDWGLLHPGDPLEDVIDAFIHWCLGSDGVVHAEKGRALLEAYRSLRPAAAQAQRWESAVTSWCAQRIIDAAHERRPLPRGFTTYLRTPASLASALELCETK